MRGTRQSSHNYLFVRPIHPSSLHPSARKCRPLPALVFLKPQKAQKTWTGWVLSPEEVSNSKFLQFPARIWRVWENLARLDRAWRPLGQWQGWSWMGFNPNQSRTEVGKELQDHQV